MSLDDAARIGSEDDDSGCEEEGFLDRVCDQQSASA